MSTIKQANYSVLELNQQQVELANSPGTEGSDPVPYGSNASSAAKDFHHDNPTHDHLSRNTVDETINNLPAEEALVYTECGEYAFTSEKGHGVITRK